MSKIDDDLAALTAAQTKLTNDVTALATGISGLEAQVTNLTAALATAGLTAAQQNELDGLATSAGALASQADVVVASLPAPVTPPSS